MHRKPLGTPCTVTLDLHGDYDLQTTDYLVSEAGSWYLVEGFQKVGRRYPGPDRYRFRCVRVAAPDPVPDQGVIEFWWNSRGR